MKFGVVICVYPILGNADLDYFGVQSSYFKYLEHSQFLKKMQMLSFNFVCTVLEDY